MLEFIKVLFAPEIVILFILCILSKIFYPKFRGFMGEFWVKTELNKLPKEKYIVLNNIMLEDDYGTHQIDHIVISNYGIFVIEMKNFYGLITGNEHNEYWIQHFGKKKFKFKNPIYQNYGHIKSLENLLKLNNDYFIPIVCFSNQAKLRVKSNIIVTQLDFLVKTIKSSCNIEYNLDINNISNTILSSNITNKSKRKKHINNIKEKETNENNKINNMICPKCGGNLIRKNGKYGSFIGCSNFPRCKYTKK